MMRRILLFGTVLVLCLTLAVPAFAQTTTHIVQRGENLFRIALRYGVTVNALAAANGLSSTSIIYVGQRLIIPTGGSSDSPLPTPTSVPTSSPSSGVHIVQRGENLFRIALRYGLTTQALAAANGIANPNRVYVGQRLVIPGSGTSPAPAPSPDPTSSGQTYTVRRGDTLSAIALRYGVSMWALAQANGISNPSLIYVGQVLKIPSGGSSTPSPSPAPSAPTSDRWIDVNLSAQQVTAYEGNTPVRSTLASTGLWGTPTPTGQFHIYAKYASTLMSGPGYYLPGVPYTMYFYRGYAIHGTYWHSNFGQPMSHGCINLPTSEAQWFYNWASVGTLVNIHY
jgi:LysM repeat protein